MAGIIGPEETLAGTWCLVGPIKSILLDIKLWKTFKIHQESEVIKVPRAGYSVHDAIRWEQFLRTCRLGQLFKKHLRMKITI